MMPRVDVFELPVLSVLREVERLVSGRTSRVGASFRFAALPRDDGRTLAGLADDAGRQVFFGGLDPAVIGQIQPAGLEELAVARAFSRPLVRDRLDAYLERKRARRVPSVHPLFDAEVGRTLGLLVFQEQCMRVWERVFGLSLGAADNIRRWLGRHPGERPLDEDRLIEVARARGVSEMDSRRILEAVLDASNACFVESHCLTYARITYWHAFAAVHHSVELQRACAAVGHDGVSELEVAA